MTHLDQLPQDVIDLIAGNMDDPRDLFNLSRTATVFHKYAPDRFELGKCLLVKALSEGYKNKTDIGIKVRYPAYQGMRMTKYMRITGSFLNMSTNMYYLQNKTSMVQLLDISLIEDKDAYFMQCLGNFELDDATIWDLSIKPFWENEYHKPIKDAILLVRSREAIEGEYGFISHLFSEE